MNSYLENHLLGLILSIQSRKTESYLLIASGMEDLISQQGILIQLGNKLEIFWNKVISDCTINLIENNNTIKVGRTNRQLDHLFMCLTVDEINYLESKCNLNFDTEKKPASNDKISRVTDAIAEKYQKKVNVGYFVPCIAEIPNDVVKKYPDVKIYGVRWMIETLQCKYFTCDEFFQFFKDVIGPILNNKFSI